jgi:TFIIF-interacting CTD phosphatase-like protein
LVSPSLKPVIRRIDEENEDKNSAARKLSFKNSNKRPLEPNPPPTPSKNMFSPHLRSDSNDGRVGNHQPGLRVGHHGQGFDACESVDTDLDVSEDSMNSPTEEIKQTSMIAEEEEEEEQNHQHEMDDDDDEVDDEDSNAFNPYLFIAELPPHEMVVEMNKICLPAKASSDSGLKTLVLDLDETLVHCTVAPIPDPDLIFPVL